jgi:glucose-6-phosphate isomerase
MSYRQVIDGCLSRQADDGLLDRKIFEQLIMRADASIDRLATLKADNALPLLACPGRRDDLAALAPLAQRFAAEFDDVIVLGTGGSSMGGQAILALTDTPSFAEPQGPRIHFMDNVDPHTIDLLARSVDFARTGMIVISKSGGTAETLSQFLVLSAAYIRAVGKDGFASRAVAVTEPDDSPLRKLATHFGLETVEHDPGLGGRFSVLSAVGALPAMIRGLAADDLRAGAAQVLDATLSSGGASAPAIGAAASIGLSALGYDITVMLPYIDRLAPFGLWYRQLWGESLGKRGKGTTPVRAMGTVDQHSQLQLYLDGPRDKMFTFLMLDVRGQGGRIDAELASAVDLDYLSGRRMGDLMDAEQRATVDTLSAAGLPTRTFKMDTLDERSLGALMMHFMLETIIAADLLGVDPFDQPAVEDGKILARDYLSRMKE